MALIDTRRDQMFPVLSAAQIATAHRFAGSEPRQFAPGDIVFDMGEHHAPAWLVLEGSIEVIRRDGRGRSCRSRSRAPDISAAKSASLPGVRHWRSGVPDRMG